MTAFMAVVLAAAVVGGLWLAAHRLRLRLLYASHARRRAEIRRVEQQIDYRIQQLAQQAMTELLEEARRRSGGADGSGRWYRS